MSTEKTRCRATVIEVYDRYAAVRFSWHGSDRVECVERRGEASDPVIGQRGWAVYTLTANTGTWSFVPFKAVR